jgi:hypothetical protein
MLPHVKGDREWFSFGIAQDLLKHGFCIAVDEVDPPKPPKPPKPKKTPVSEVTDDKNQ